MAGKIFNVNQFEETIKRIQSMEYFQDNFPGSFKKKIRSVMQHKEKAGVSGLRPKGDYQVQKPSADPD